MLDFTMGSTIRHRSLNKTSTESSSDYLPIDDSKQPNAILIKLLFILKILILIVLFVLLILFVIIPFVFRFSPTIQRLTLFMNFVNLHYFRNLSKPEEFGLKCTHSFHLSQNGYDSIGVWYVPPKEDACNFSQLPFNIQELTKDNNVVVLYAHGNGGTRGANHRVALYKKLSNQIGTHVIAFDYQGYGDSYNLLPNASSVVSDTDYVYKWLLEKGVTPSRILVWGHSLGTAIISKFMSECSNEDTPFGAVIEAPFTTLKEEIYGYPMSKFFKFLPYFKYCFVDPLVNNPATNFNTTAVLPNVRSPLIILHAKDDRVIPFSLGKKLYEQAVELQPEPTPRAKFVSYPADLHYGHKAIHLDPNLAKTVIDFIKSIKGNFTKV